MRLEAIEERLLQKLWGIVGYELNPNSPTKVMEYLYDQKGLKPKIKRSTGKRTSDEEAMLQLMKEHSLPEIPLFLQLKHISKIRGTCYRNQLDADGRLHTSWNVAGAVTGRWSSSKTAWYTGSDVQNIPYYERKMTVPDEGMEFSYADLAQAEARVVAHAAKEEAYIASFVRGEDTHRMNASYCLSAVYHREIKPEDITKEERYAIKQVVHASNYGAAARTISITMGKRLRGKSIKDAIRDPEALNRRGVVFNTAQAKAVQNSYFNRWLRIKSWHMEVEADLRRTRTVITPLGRKRNFFDRLNDKTIREAIDQLPQATVADIINMGVARLHLCLPETADLLLQNHDAALVQGFPEDREVIDVCLHNALTYWLHDPELVIPVEIQRGMNWYELEEVEE